MKTQYKQMLIDQKTHDDISAAKALLGSLVNKKLSSKEIIGEFLGRRLRLLTLNQEIRSYINAFVNIASLNKNVLGIMLFGSVARNRFGRFSDIDLLVVVSGKAMGHFGEITGIIDGIESFRKVLILQGLHLRIRPMVISEKNLSYFRPIYIDLLEDGIVLFERNDILFNFMNDIRKSVDYEKTIVGNAVMLRWKIKG